MAAPGKSKSNQRGGFRPGAGRKSKAEKLLKAGFVANWFTAEFQEIKWKKLVNSDDEKIQLEAMKYLTDRLYGKATQPLDVTGELKLADRIAAARKRANI